MARNDILRGLGDNLPIELSKVCKLLYNIKYQEYMLTEPNSISRVQPNQPTQRQPRHFLNWPSLRDIFSSLMVKSRVGQVIDQR